MYRVTAVLLCILLGPTETLLAQERVVRGRLLGGEHTWAGAKVGVPGVRAGGIAGSMGRFLFAGEFPLGCHELVAQRVDTRQLRHRFLVTSQAEIDLGSLELVYHRNPRLSEGPTRPIPADTTGACEPTVRGLELDWIAASANVQGTVTRGARALIDLAIEISCQGVVSETVRTDYFGRYYAVLQLEFPTSELLYKTEPIECSIKPAATDLDGPRTVRVAFHDPVEFTPTTTVDLELGEARRTSFSYIGPVYAYNAYFTIPGLGQVLARYDHPQRQVEVSVVEGPGNAEFFLQAVSRSVRPGRSNLAANDLELLFPVPAEKMVSRFIGISLVMGSDNASSPSQFVIPINSDAQAHAEEGGRIQAFVRVPASAEASPQYVAIETDYAWDGQEVRFEIPGAALRRTGADYRADVEVLLMSR